MPGGDRTGPAGMGPMTGRAAGYCAGYPVPGYLNPVVSPALWAGGAYGRLSVAYLLAPYGAVPVPYDRQAGYLPAWGGGFGRRYGRGFGRGFGRGPGRGRGMGRRW